MYRSRVDAVHRLDLEEFLETLGVLERVKAGQYHCSLCEKVISLESIARIILHKDHPEFRCVECSYQQEGDE